MGGATVSEQGEPTTEETAMAMARREAERMSLEQRVEAGVYRLFSGRIIASTGDRHMIPGVRLERFARGKSAEL